MTEKQQKKGKILPIIITITILIAGAGFFFFQFSNTAPQQTTEKAEPKLSLLFFMNPNGRPCQMQDDILKQEEKNIGEFAKIYRLKTTNAGHGDFFSRYGVRSLPTLIVLNESGEEVKRFSPGMHESEEIMAVLKVYSKG